MTRRREDQARPAGRSARPQRLVSVDERVDGWDLILFAVLIVIAAAVIVGPPTGTLGVDSRHLALLTLILTIATRKAHRP